MKDGRGPFKSIPSFRIVSPIKTLSHFLYDYWYDSVVYFTNPQTPGVEIKCSNYTFINNHKFDSRSTHSNAVIKSMSPSPSTKNPRFVRTDTSGPRRCCSIRHPNDFGSRFLLKCQLSLFRRKMPGSVSWTAPRGMALGRDKGEGVYVVSGKRRKKHEIKNGRYARHCD